MNIENVNVSLAETPDKPIEIILRSGVEPDPVPLHEQSQINIKGDINTPLAILATMPHLISKEAYAVCDINYGMITLNLNPSDVKGGKAIGVLEINPDFAKIKVNEEASFNSKAFIRLLQHNAHLLTSREHARQIIDSLRYFTAKIETVLVDKDDRKGNTNIQVEKRLKREQSGIPEFIQLALPVLKTSKTKTAIDFEIEIDIVDNNVYFGLFSLQYKTIVTEIFEEHLKNQCQQIDNYCPVIYT